MASKWINKDLFNQFVEEKQNEESKKKTGPRRSEMIWETPEAGTQDKAKVYEGRFVPDQTGKFYKRYMYHGFKVGDRWYFPLCDKTYDFYNWCPFCAATSKLYTGSASDKTHAGNIKRREKFVGNFFIIDDPRDDGREDKIVGTVKLYEFPMKVESKIKNTITDQKNGLGESVFDPGPDGYNFIIKVKSTKPTKDNKVWPDYSDSEFARKPSALGSEKEIDKIMETTFNLDEYIDSKRMSDEDIISLLKSELLWEYVKDEWSKYRGGSVKEEAATEVKARPEAPKAAPASNVKKNSEEDVQEPEMDEDDQDLLRELDEL